MTEWNYLTLEPFKMRYVLAAHIVRDCKTIVEIGPYKTPISDFLPYAWYDSIILCDMHFGKPHTELTPVGWIKRWPGEFQHYMAHMPESDFGLVTLGMEIKGDFEPFIDLVNRCRVAVVEYPVDWQPSVDQFERILRESTKEIDMQIELDFSRNKTDNVKGAPVRAHRLLSVLK